MSDSKQDAVKRLQEAAEKVRSENYEGRFDVRGVLLDVLGFVVYVALGFGWMMLMLLIISFVSLGYLHMRIEKMFLVAGAFGILAGIYYVFKMVRKYRK